MADGLSTDDLTSGVSYATGAEVVLLLGGAERGVVLTTVTGVFYW